MANDRQTINLPTSFRQIVKLVVQVDGFGGLEDMTYLEVTACAEPEGTSPSPCLEPLIGNNYRHCIVTSKDRRSMRLSGGKS